MTTMTEDLENFKTAIDLRGFNQPRLSSEPQPMTA